MQNRMQKKRTRRSPRKGGMSSFSSKEQKSLVHDSTGRAGSSLYSGLGGFPDHARVRLSYAEEFSMTTTVASVTQAFRGNGPYDPNSTGTGGQPLNYDDFALRYNRYKVIASSIVVKALTSSASNMAKVIVYPSNSSIALSVPEAAALPRAKFQYIQGGSIGWTFKLNCNSSAIDGSFPGQFLGRESIDAQVTAVPADQWYWHIVQSSFDNSTSVTGYYEVVVIYDVVFYDRTDGRLDLLDRLVELRSARKAFLAKRRTAREEVKVSDQKTSTEESKQTAATAAKSDSEYEMIDLRGQSLTGLGLSLVKLRR